MFSSKTIGFPSTIGEQTNQLKKNIGEHNQSYKINSEQEENKNKNRKMSKTQEQTIDNQPVLNTEKDIQSQE